MHFPFFGKKKFTQDVQDAAAHGVAVLETADAARRAPFFVRLWRSIVGIPEFFKSTFLRLVLFVVLLLFYIVARGIFSVYGHVRKLLRSPSPRSSEEMFAALYSKIEKLFRIERRKSIDRISLIGIAVRNMKVKKTRTAITIGGMALGIASIVFLVSLGYGVQRLVVSQVARLEEMRQMDVSPQAGGKVKIDDETLSNMREIPNVESVAPLVAVVGKVNYQGSVSDMAVYAVTSDYLRQSAIQPSSGKIFESNDLSANLPAVKTVAGISDSVNPKGFGDILEPVSVRADSTLWVRLRESPDSKARLLGYGRISRVPVSGDLVAGEPYGSTVPDSGEAYRGTDGEPFGKWISSEMPLWEKSSDCGDVSECSDGFSPAKNSSGSVRVEQGYFALVDDEVEISLMHQSDDEPDSVSGMVLGESTEAVVSPESAALSESASGSDDTSATVNNIKVSSSDGEWVELDLGDSSEGDKSVDRVALGDAAKREAVVNRAMLQVLSLSESEAIGKKFNVSFVISGSLLGGKAQKAESVESEYSIIGVIPDDKTPVFYMPFIDARTLGVVNYSQVKLTVATQESLANVRRQIEGMGYVTTSVADTVEQINNFFGTARIVLALLGMAALGVAALGMFNTLTVSLLERTREVGLMKAMGMKAFEVQELFLTESMVMSFFGGVLGLFLGFLAGKSIGVLISTVAFFRDKNLGVLDVAYIPNLFVITILIFSLAVGVLTGLYPARRATKISALNALRYE
ncbi:MAG: ABC transporter permease [Candidatus Moraniibacteriota bacterium]|nr:MAG: ABC transporter permease [Candidatus Moranbacteria bacterium]